MTSDFFAPIGLTGPYFDECDFYVRKETPKGNLLLDLDLDIPTEQEYTDEDGNLTLIHEMRLRVSLNEVLDDERTSEAMHASVSMRGAVSVPLDVQASRSDLEAYLLLNAISLFYSSARSYIDALSSQSPMGRFTIPAIDPKKYLDMAKGM